VTAYAWPPAKMIVYTESGGEGRGLIKGAWLKMGRGLIKGAWLKGAWLN